MSSVGSVPEWVIASGISVAEYRAIVEAERARGWSQASVGAAAAAARVFTSPNPYGEGGGGGGGGGGRALVSVSSPLAPYSSQRGFKGVLIRGVNEKVRPGRDSETISLGGDKKLKIGRAKTTIYVEGLDRGNKPFHIEVAEAGTDSHISRLDGHFGHFPGLTNKRPIDETDPLVGWIISKVSESLQQGGGGSPLSVGGGGAAAAAAAWGAQPAPGQYLMSQVSKKEGKGGVLYDVDTPTCQGAQVIKFVGSPMDETLPTVNRAHPQRVNVKYFSNYFSYRRPDGSADSVLSVMIGSKQYRVQTPEQKFHILKAIHFGNMPLAQKIATLHSHSQWGVAGRDDETISNAARGLTGRQGELRVAAQGLKEWDQSFSTRGMVETLVQKFELGSYIADILCKTGKCVLVENTEGQSYAQTGDVEIWGNGKDDRGRNRLGIILMVLKANLLQGKELNVKALTQEVSDMEEKIRPARTGSVWTSPQQTEHVMAYMDQKYGLNRWSNERQDPF